jgi:hypothetical protein
VSRFDHILLSVHLGKCPCQYPQRRHLNSNTTAISWQRPAQNHSILGKNYTTIGQAEISKALRGQVTGDFGQSKVFGQVTNGARPMCLGTFQTRLRSMLWRRPVHTGWRSWWDLASWLLLLGIVYPTFAQMSCQEAETFADRMARQANQTRGRDVRPFNSGVARSFHRRQVVSRPSYAGITCFPGPVSYGI